MGQKDLKAYKEDYESVHMSEDQVEQMKKRMQQAKQETQGKKIIEMGKRGNRILKIGATAAAVALVFVALPNTSASVAQAMEQVPVLGNLVSAVTFRDYQYDDGKNMADVDEPKLVAGDTDNANVAQSVTEVNAEIAAIRRFLLSTLPPLSTAPARSTSVSKMMPKSALVSMTASTILCMASLFSGLGMWLGKVPSGSRNWLPCVSAPRGARTLST